MTISPEQQRAYAFWFGTSFIVLLFVAFLTIFFLEIYKIPALFQLFEFFFRVVLAGSLAGVAAMIPGYFEIDWTEKLGLRAGGAFAVFLLIFMVNPPRLISDYSEEARISDLFIGCDQLKGGTEPSADTVVYCDELFASFPDHWKAQLAMAKLNSVRGNHQESLEFALNATSAFYAMTGESIFSALADAESANHHDSIKILHTFRNSSWGANSFGLSNTLLSHAINAGMITPDEAVFERKFNSGQAIIRHISAISSDSLSIENDTDFDYELFYDSCLLSWQYLVDPSEELRVAAVEKYNLARSRVWARDGTNAATQRIHFECLEASVSGLSHGCGQSIGVPQYCPIFNLLKS